MRIIANDGVEFLSVEECEVYEKELAARKAKEEAEKKAKEKVKNDHLEKIKKLYSDYLNELNDYQSKHQEVVGVIHNTDGHIKVTRYPKSESIIINHINDILNKWYIE